MHERCSENDLRFGKRKTYSNTKKDVQKVNTNTVFIWISDFIPSVESSPFLPTSTKCLKAGYLAKVIMKNGRLVIGRIRYIGPLISGSLENRDEECAIFVGLQLRTNFGECDGSFEGRKIFDW